VTLAALLVSTGIGALVSQRLMPRARFVMPVLLVAIALLTVFYEIGLDSVTDGLQQNGLAVRVIVSVVVLFPLGLCLGMFMPFGLAAVSRLTPHAQRYVAWGWAVNGFFSVIGSVLTTMLSMTFGFRAVQLGAVAMYAIAVLAYRRIERRAPSDEVAMPFVDAEVEPPVAATFAPT
jgi:MFS family permease